MASRSQAPHVHALHPKSSLPVPATRRRYTVTVPTPQRRPRSPLNRKPPFGKTPSPRLASSSSLSSLGSTPSNYALTTVTNLPSSTSLSTLEIPPGHDSLFDYGSFEHLKDSIFSGYSDSRDASVRKIQPADDSFLDLSKNDGSEEDPFIFDSIPFAKSSPRPRSLCIPQEKSRDSAHELQQVIARAVAFSALCADEDSRMSTRDSKEELHSLIDELDALASRIRAMGVTLDKGKDREKVVEESEAVMLHDVLLFEPFSEQPRAQPMEWHIYDPKAAPEFLVGSSSSDIVEAASGTHGKQADRIIEKPPSPPPQAARPRFVKRKMSLPAIIHSRLHHTHSKLPLPSTPRSFVPEVPPPVPPLPQPPRSAPAHQLSFDLVGLGHGRGPSATPLIARRVTNTHPPTSAPAQRNSFDHFDRGPPSTVKRSTNSQPPPTTPAHRSSFDHASHGSYIPPPTSAPAHQRSFDHVGLGLGHTPVPPRRATSTQPPPQSSVWSSKPRRASEDHQLRLHISTAVGGGLRPSSPTYTRKSLDSNHPSQDKERGEGMNREVKKPRTFSLAGELRRKFL